MSQVLTRWKVKIQYKPRRERAVSVALFFTQEEKPTIADITTVAEKYYQDLGLDYPYPFTHVLQIEVAS